MASRTPGEPEELYCVYIPVFNVNARLPINVDGVAYEPYMYRAWVVCDYAHDFTRDTDPMHPALIDQGPLERTTLLDTYDKGDFPWAKNSAHRPSSARNSPRAMKIPPTTTSP